MARPRNISNIYDAPKSNVQFSEGQKSKGILDDHAVRQNVASREGTIEHTPTADNHIANKKYVDDQFPVTHASTTGQTTDDHHAETHTIVSHDTTGTGAELDTLTDDSMADTLHRHSELSASDGTPDQALTIDSSGDITYTGDMTIPNSADAIKSGDYGIQMRSHSLNTAGGRGLVVNTANALTVNGSTLFEVRNNGTTNFIINRIGRVGIGTNSPSRKVEVVDASVPQIIGGTNDTDATSKQIGVGCNHYTTSEEPIGMLLTLAGATFNSVIFGGGSNNVNAATHLQFFTAATSTTVYGTERMRIMPDGKVGIGTTSPATSAKLDITSTTGALLLPRMTTVQRNALTAVNGMLIYDSTLNQTQTYENGAWRQI